MPQSGLSKAKIDRYIKKSGTFKAALFIAQLLQRIFCSHLNNTAMVVPLNFNMLSRADQADLLQAEGRFVHSRQESDFVIDRYQLHDFYVDICYQLATGEVVSVKSFYTRQQQPPIYQMQLPRLFIRKGA